MLADVQLERATERILGLARQRSRRLGRPILVSWTRPAALADTISFFESPELEAPDYEPAPTATGPISPTAPRRVLWLRPDSEEGFVGVGCAALIEGRGSERFEQVGEAWRKLLADALIGDADDLPDAAGWHPGPMLLGGFSFDPQRPSTALWEAFPDARFVLPERMLSARHGASWVTTNVLVDALDSSEATLGEPSELLPTRTAASTRPLDAREWQQLVGTVAAGIGDGQLGVDKVVLARAHQVGCELPIDPATALRKLADAYPTCTVFAVDHGEATFLGATPERLIGLERGEASTMALAASIGRGATPAEDDALATRLLTDPKERREHEVVVDTLRADLARDGLCFSVVADPEPRIRRLANLQHLLTSIRAQVRPGTTVLDLVERLHPSPAVGGFPRERALELLREREALDRGWYAAPVGWIDRHRDGEFVVALRSALVHRESATLFAGCGIVADSNPAAEYAEWQWKLRPMLAALGCPAR
jgi:isochorismate synthase